MSRVFGYTRAVLTHAASDRGDREAPRTGGLVARVAARFGVAPEAVRVTRVPLRVCPLGAHIDHQGGRVTGVTLDRAVLFAFAPSGDSSVVVQSDNFPDEVRFVLGTDTAGPAGSWGDYLRGAAQALAQRHRLERGLVGRVSGEMPIGGLSSSAAVTIAYLLALEEVNGVSASEHDNIELVQHAENRFIGLQNGILDQSVILCSASEHLTDIDCLTREIDRVPLGGNPRPFEIAIAYSGLSSSLMATDYNARVSECQEAARQLLRAAPGMAPAGASRLRDVPRDVYETESRDLPEPLRRRARHFFDEMRRVEDGIGAWRAGDLPRLGELINQSGESSIANYECGSPQLITMFRQLRRTPGVLGARFSGAGFRGSCVALVDPAAREEIAEETARHYRETHPEQADRFEIHFCRTGGAAELQPASR